MKTYWITAILISFITLGGFWRLTVPAAEVQRVHFGSTITLSCNISYLYDTAWLKQSPDHSPTVVLCASLKGGKSEEGGCQFSSRYSVSLMDRSFALRITDIEEGDLGLYYCISNSNMQVKVGRGTRLCATLPDSSWFRFQHWYAVVVGSGLLIMMLAVCITHWKTRQMISTNKTCNEYH